MSDAGKPKRKWLRTTTTTVAMAAMTVVFGAWGVVDCADHSSNPPAINEACSSSPDDLCTAGQAAAGSIKSKRGLTNRMLWKWANGTFVAFDVADHRAFFDWGYNLATRNIRWISKSGMGRCLTPIGTCETVYGVWRTEVCDRSGPDTCGFRREADQKVSSTYGVAFNRHLISCLGTRINWDGSHTRNTWAGDCSGGGATALATRVGPDELTIGRGPNPMDVGSYVPRRKLGALDRACIGPNATGARCRRAANRLYHGLPERVQRKLAHEMGDDPGAAHGPGGLEVGRRGRRHHAGRPARNRGAGAAPDRTSELKQRNPG